MRKRLEGMAGYRASRCMSGDGFGYRASRCMSRVIVIRIGRRRRLRAAWRMARAGWREAEIARALGLARHRVREAMHGRGLWTSEERRALLMGLAAEAHVARGAIAETTTTNRRVAA